MENRSAANSELQELLSIIDNLHKAGKLETNYEDVVATIKDKFETAQAIPSETKSFRVLYKNIKRMHSEEDDLVDYLEDYLQATQIAQKAHFATMEKIHQITASLIQTDTSFKDLGDPIKCQKTVIFYLAKKEEEWNKPGTLPPLHSKILLLHESGKQEDELKECIRTIIVDGQMSSAVQLYERQVTEKIWTLSPNTPLEKVLAVLGTGMIAGMGTLALLVPQVSAYKSLFDGLNSALLSSAVTSGASMGIVSGVFVAGIVTLNAYRCITGKISKKEAGINILEAVGSMSIGTLVTIGAAAACASVAPPIWITALIFATVGMGASIVSGVAIRKLLNWAWSESPTDSELDEAYVTLGLTTNASDEDIRKQYRIFSRKYHPDILMRDGASDEDFKQARENLEKVQNAYQTIIAAKCRNPGFLEKIGKFFKDLWKPEDEPCKRAIALGL